MEKKIFGVYIRVSTDMQVESGDSIEAQKNLANSLVEKEGGIVYKHYIEGGVSASKTQLKDRPKLMECLNDIENGTINGLVAYKRDRLARKTEDSLAIRKILKDNDCRMLFTATGEQEMELDDPYAKLMENVRSSLDEIESAQTSIRVSDTMFDKAKRGEFSGGNLPYGLELKDKKIVAIESEITVLEEVVDMYLEGFGKYSIAKWLEGKEVKNKGKRFMRAKKLKQHKRSSDKWTVDVIDSILFNPMYSGYMRYTQRVNNKQDTVEVKSEYIEPIRSEELQNIINLERDKRSRKVASPRRYSTSFLLTGIMFCSECGREYGSRTVTKKNGKRYSYYICKGRQGNYHTYPCKSKSYKKELIEEFIFEEAKKYIKNFVDSNVHLRVKEELEKKDNKLEEKLEEVNRDLYKKNRDFESISRLIMDLDMDDDMYETMRNMYQTQQKTILKDLNSLKETQKEINIELDKNVEEEFDIENIVEQLGNFNKIIEYAPFHLQKQALESLFSKIEIDIDGNVLFHLTFEIDKDVATVDFATIGRVEVSDDNSVMFFGGVGDTTPVKNITITSKEKSISINYYTWLSDLVTFIEDSFYSFFTNSNDELSSPKYFSIATGLSNYSHKAYRLNNTIPSLENCKRILEAANTSVSEYADFINKNGIMCSEKILESVLDDSNVIKRNIKRYMEA